MGVEELVPDLLVVNKESDDFFSRLNFGYELLEFLETSLVSLLDTETLDLSPQKLENPVVEEGDSAASIDRRRVQRKREFSGSQHGHKGWDGKSVKRKVLPSGEIQYTIQSGQRNEILRLDPSGFAIFANDDHGRTLGNLIIGSGEMSLIMIDVNFLGKINYFENGTIDGDKYLSSVAQVISEVVGDLGIPMRWGGDEFVIAVKSMDVDVVKALQKKIIDNVSDHIVAKSIFQRELDTKYAMYKLVQSSKNYDGLPARFKETLIPREQAFAQSDFTNFLAQHRKVDGKAIYDAQAILPSVSIGSALVGESNVDVALQKAEQIAERSKVLYKTELGIDVSKYLGRDLYLPDEPESKTSRNLNARPESMEPAPLPDNFNKIRYWVIGKQEKILRKSTIVL